jgi:hypothetical protein
LPPEAFRRPSCICSIRPRNRQYPLYRASRYSHHDEPNPPLMTISHRLLLCLRTAY